MENLCMTHVSEVPANSFWVTRIERQNYVINILSLATARLWHHSSNIMILMINNAKPNNKINPDVNMYIGVVYQRNIVETWFQYF